MSHVFVKAAEKFGLSTLASLAEAGADLRVALLMEGNSCVADRATAEFVDDLTLDEFDGAGYVRQALASQTWTLDAANFRTELTATANVWDDLPAGSGEIVGALVYFHITNDADSPVLAYCNGGGFPKPATGSPFTVTWSTDGLIQFACPVS